MDFRRWLVVGGLCTAFFSCGHREVARPNVLLITLDTFRADRLDRCPNLRQLARESVLFDEANAAVPLTLPSHATILSGLLPPHHGLRNNGTGSFPIDRPTLGSIFSAAGYRTGAFVSAFVLDHRFGLNRGFDTYDDAIARDPNSSTPFDAERRGSDTVDRATAWLARDKQRPFFAWVHLYDAHAPYAPPDPYPRTYDGEIAYVDAQVGRLLAVIDRSSTLVVVVGDHGESLGEHGELTHGLLLYQPTLHVPMMIGGPGASSGVLHEPVSSADLAPTIVSLALHQTLKADGADLSASVRAHHEAARHDLYAESEYASMFGWSDLASLRRGTMKLIESSSPELYDLHADPHERVNILNDQRRTFRSLGDVLTNVRRNGVRTQQPAAVDDETRAKLASLGYVAPGPATNPNGPRPSPSTMAPLFRIFEEANWASNENRSADAIAKLRSIVTQDPRNPVFRSTLARELRKSGRLPEAIALYKEAVAIAPEDSDAWYNLAVALQEAGQAQEGAIAIREALRRDPQRAEAHNALGIAYVSDGDLKSAEVEFAKAIAIDPRDARALTNLGNVYRARNAFEDAAREYEQALSLSPNYVDALNGLGVVEVQRDRPRVAVTYFDRALAIAPLFFEAQLNRGIALQLAGDRASAAQQFRDLLARLPRTRDFDGPRRAATDLLLQLEHSH
jgi:arylsulfatase A-like enzyme/tetratricopeptide (TPR) repeat protein